MFIGEKSGNARGTGVDAGAGAALDGAMPKEKARSTASHAMEKTECFTENPKMSPLQ